MMCIDNHGYSTQTGTYANNIGTTFGQFAVEEDSNTILWLDIAVNNKETLVVYSPLMVPAIQRLL